MAKFNGSVSNIEDNRNKVANIGDNSTDVEYPTARAVYLLAGKDLHFSEYSQMYSPEYDFDFDQNFSLWSVKRITTANPDISVLGSNDVCNRAYNDQRYIMQNAKVTEIADSPTDNQIPTAKAVKDYVDESGGGGGDMTAYLKRDGTRAMTGNLNMDNNAITNIGNLVTSISSSSTDNQFPSAKCVYDAIQAALYVDTSTVIIAAD